MAQRKPTDPATPRATPPQQRRQPAPEAQRPPGEAEDAASAQEQVPRETPRDRRNRYSGGRAGNT